MAQVVIDNVSKTFKGSNGEPIHALRKASFSVEKTEFLALVGPSACGKTTMLRLISGLEDITEGSISIDGHIVDDVPPKDRDVAMVFQNYALYPHMNVFENMSFGLKLRKLPRAEIERRVQDAAIMLGLALVLGRMPNALSGGQRQRVALGRAIVRKPKVLLFDEPLSNLDPPMRLQMRAEISRLHARLGATMVYVTHDHIEAMTLADRIVVMSDGVIHQVADPLTLYQRPANLFVAGFIGSPPMNFFHGLLWCKGYTLFFQEKDSSAGGERASLRVPDEATAKLTDHVGREVILGVRPENISICNQPAADSIPATVERVELIGPEAHLHFNTGAHQFVARVPPCAIARTTEKVLLSFDMGAAHFFDPVTEKSLLHPEPAVLNAGSKAV